MRALYWLVAVAVAALLSLFAVSNRVSVPLGLWPLPFLADVPLYLVVFVALLAGFVAGAAAAWIGGHRTRRALRDCRRRGEALARELSATQSRLASTAQSASPPVPATRR